MQPSSIMLRTEPSKQPLKCIPELYSAFGSFTAFVSTLFGTHLSWLLFGFLIAQTYKYCIHPEKDHPFFRTLVYCGIFVVTIETVVEGLDAFWFLSSGWGTPLALNTPFTVAVNLGGNLQPIFAALPAVFVQFFFTWRIWTFCMAVYGRRVKLLVVGICLFLTLAIICSFTSSILSVAYVIIIAEAPAINEGLDWIVNSLTLVWVTTSAAVDATITICMIIILSNSRTGASSEETYDRISGLLRLTIQTGFLTSALAIIVIPLPFTSINILTIPFFLLGKSYVLTLLANLNARTTQPIPDPNKVIKRVIRRPVNSSGGVLSFIRSTARTIRHDLTSSPNENLTGENVGIDEAESQLQVVEHGEEPGSIRGEDNPGLDEPEDLA